MSPTLSTLTITKRDKTQQPFDIEKLHRVCSFACEGVEGVSPSELEYKVHSHLYDGITTDEINEFLVSSAKSLIEEPTYNFDIVGGRLLAFIVRKKVYGDIKPWPLKELVQENIKRNVYDPDLYSYYTEAEWDTMDSYVVHERDFTFRLAGADQMRTKYLAKDRVTKELYESFQIPYILVSAVLFKDEPKHKRLSLVKQFYDLASQHYISLPTPIMAGIRTIRKQGSSCVLIDVGDDLDSIIAADGAATKYIADKAGLGINIGRLRGFGAPIRGGNAVHTGNIPFIKKLTATVKSCSQGGVRDGAVTFYFPLWSYEFPELVVLKDGTLAEEHTNRSADYCVQVNKFLLQRLISGGKISLFSPYDTPGLYEAFFDSTPGQPEFARLYEKYENDPSVRRRTFEASEVFGWLVAQRNNTGRIYISFVDTMNEHSAFVDPIYMSNLCTEIALPTKPLKALTSGWEDGAEISICTLAAVNWGKITRPEQFATVAPVLVRALDNLLSYQDYPVKAAKDSTLRRRPLGIGVIGFAHWLAKMGLRYNRSALATVDRYVEAWAYYLTKASADLALEKGPCPAWKQTTYALGLTPNSNRARKLDEILPHVERLDWSSLREQISTWGIRNSTLMALMPSETSSQLSNETNGIEPPRSPIVSKGSKDVTTPIVVPDVEELYNDYDWLMAQRGPRGYLEMAAVFQKYTDQAISVNTSYNPLHYEDEKISTTMLLSDIIYAYQLGHKNLYYNNCKKPGEKDILDDDSGCESGACKI